MTHINKLSSYHKLLLKDKTMKILKDKLKQNIEPHSAETGIKFCYEGQEYHAYYYKATCDYGDKYWTCEVSEYDPKDDTISFDNVITWNWYLPKRQFSKYPVKDFGYL